MCYTLYLVHMPLELIVGPWLCLRGVDSPLSVLLITAHLSLCVAITAGGAFHVLVDADS